MTPEEQSALENEARAVEGEVITAAEQAAGAGPEPVEEPGMTTGQAMTALTRAATKIFAPNWEVTDDECTLFGESAGAVVDKWLPHFDIGPELSLVLAVAMIAGPRWGTPLRKPAPKAEESTTDAPAVAG